MRRKITDFGSFSLPLKNPGYAIALTSNKTITISYCYFEHLLTTKYIYTNERVNQMFFFYTRNSH